MTSLRYGIIGTGMMGIEHIQNLLTSTGVEITARIGPRIRVAARRRRARSRRRGVCGTIANSSPMACATAVVVASPNMTHIDSLTDLLATDLHVLVEKPLCTTVDDCYTVLDLADGARCPHMGRARVSLHAAHRSIDRRSRRRRHRSSRMVSIREHRFPFLEKVGDWNRFSRNTGGTLVEKCCHFFDLMCRVMPGSPIRVMASGAQDVNHLDERYDGETPDILDKAFVIVEFDDGGRGLLDLCMFR